MSKSGRFEMYEQLMAEANNALFGNVTLTPKNGLATYDPNDEESEDFLTSKEIVKMQQDQGKAEDGVVQLPKGPVEIEEDVHFKRYSKRREHRYTESELEAIRESCESTIVHDYSEYDNYHLSDEERARNDSLNELRMKLNGLTKMYRKIDKYIEAMRVVVEAWELLEKRDNFAQTREEFFKMVAEGKIYNNSILMPKMRGLDKFNMDLVIRYISNPELDPTDLVPAETKKPQDSWYEQFEDDEDEETEEEEMERLLSPDEVQYILDNIDNPPKIKVQDIKPRLIRGYDHRTITKKKKLRKKERFIADNLHPLLTKIQSNPANRNDGIGIPRTYLLTSSIFEPEKKQHDFWDDLYFDGSWTSKDDLFLYDMAVREEMLKQHPAGDRYGTYADRELKEFFRIMEQNGINVVELRRRMNMSEQQEKVRESKKVKRENRKIESNLLQRITKLNGDPKFKKLIAKAEKAIAEQIEEY